MNWMKWNLPWQPWFLDSKDLNRHQGLNIRISAAATSLPSDCQCCRDVWPADVLPPVVLPPDSLVAISRTSHWSILLLAASLLCLLDVDRLGTLLLSLQCGTLYGTGCYLLQTPYPGIPNTVPVLEHTGCWHPWYECRSWNQRHCQHHHWQSENGTCPNHQNSTWLPRWSSRIRFIPLLTNIRGDICE